MIQVSFIIAFSHLLRIFLEMQNYFSKTVGRKNVEKCTLYFHITRVRMHINICYKNESLLQVIIDIFAEVSPPDPKQFRSTRFM